MSLLRLLTAGRSLVGLKDEESRYRVTNQRLLPKFGAKRNPFRQMTPAESAAETATTAAEPAVADATTAEPELVKPVVAEAAVESAEVQSPAPAPTPLVAAQVPEVAPSANSGSEAKSSLVSTRNLLQRLKAKLRASWGRRGPRAATGPELKRPVQVELSLDRIRVVRNDLSDSDLEIVPARAPKPSDQGRVSEPAKGGASSRSRLGTLLFIGSKNDSPKEAAK